MRIAYWITKPINTRSEYIQLIALPLQQLLHERASVLCCMYIACLFHYVIVTKVFFKHISELKWTFQLWLFSNCYFLFCKQSSFPRYGLYLVGSTMNGFGSDNSDVDMCLLVRHTEMDQRNEAVLHLEQMLKCLRRCGESFTMMWCLPRILSHC